MSSYKISLTGDGVKGKRVKASVLSAVIDTLIDGAKGSVRLRIDGRSSAPGASPSWLDAVCDFDITGIVEGSTEIQIDCQPLHVLDPGKFAQLKAFCGIGPGASALSLFADGLRDAAAGKKDSDYFDDALLSTYERLNCLYGYGIDKLRFEDSTDKGNDITLTPDVSLTIRTLKQETPTPQAVRLSGQVDSIRASDKMFELVLLTGDKLKVVAPPSTDTEHMKDIFGQFALVSGRAVFRPNGSVLRIECTNVEKDVLKKERRWSKMPTPRQNKIFAPSLRKQQTETSGLNRIWGLWPGDESDSEVQQAFCK